MDKCVLSSYSDHGLTENQADDELQGAEAQCIVMIYGGVTFHEHHHYSWGRMWRSLFSSVWVATFVGRKSHTIALVQLAYNPAYSVTTAGKIKIVPRLQINDTMFNGATV